MDCKFYIFSLADDWLTANNFKLVIDTYNNPDDQASGRYKTYLNTTYYIFLTISEDVNNIDQIDYMEYFFRWKLFSNLIPFIDKSKFENLRGLSSLQVANLSQIVYFSVRQYATWRCHPIFDYFVEVFALLTTIGEFQNWNRHDQFPNLLTRHERNSISKYKAFQIFKDRLDLIVLKLRLKRKDYKLNIQE